MILLTAHHGLSLSAAVDEVAAETAFSGAVASSAQALTALIVPGLVEQGQTSARDAPLDAR